MDNQEFQDYKQKVDYLYNLHKYAFVVIGVAIVGYIVFKENK